MRARQRILRIGIVIEFSARPLHRRMTGLARRREECRYVVRIRRPLVLRKVARHAIHRRTRKSVIDVARSARRIHVRARQSEAGRTVIEFRARPLCCRMARLARRRETR